MTVDSCPCPCGKTAVKVGGSVVYPKREDLHGLAFFRCEECLRYVGAHPNGTPKGTPADAPTRNARKNAHQHFDTLWRKKPENGALYGGTVWPDAPNPLFASRTEAYAWLSKEFGVESAHIGMMTQEEAESVPDRVRAYRREIEGEPAEQKVEHIQ